MHSNDGISEMHARLVRLEKQNRRTKQIGAVALILVTSLLIMGQGSPKKSIEANEFILKDGSNNVRARLSVQEPLDAPEMVFFDEKGRPSLELHGGYVSQGQESAKGGGVALFDSKNNERASFLVDDNGAYLRLSDVTGSATTLLRENAVLVRRGSVLIEDGALVAHSEDTKATAIVAGGSIEASDEQGFLARLGTGELVTPKTGETHKTSAAALVLFDKEKNVIWRAP